MFNLNGKIALITGASGGIGKSIAHKMKLSGARIILSGTRKEVLDDLATDLGGDVEVIVANLDDKESIISMAKKAEEYSGQVDILINNAAIDAKVKNKTSSEFGRLENFTLEQWNKELSVGLTGAFLCSKYFNYYK